MVNSSAGALVKHANGRPNGELRRSERKDSVVGMSGMLAGRQKPGFWKSLRRIDLAIVRRGVQVRVKPPSTVNASPVWKPEESEAR